MYRKVLAFDFDGTLARNGTVPTALQQALEQLYVAGHALFLATGRRYESVNLGPLARVFTGIVWENGAVLCRTSTSEAYMPFGYVSPHVVEALEEAHVPLEHGLAIVSSWTEHEETIWRVLNDQGGDIAAVRNKGALMIVPPGATKGSGMERLLALCGYSPRNLVSFGDAENDVSLLQVGELGVAVGDAVPSLKETADLVTDKPGPDGVLEALQTYWLDGRPPDTSSRHERWVRLGNDEDDTPFFLPGAELVGKNLGVFGDTGAGKSWVAGLLVEGVHLSGYQCLLIDPEGDFRGLRNLPGVVVLEGDQHSMASPTLVATLLEETPASVVVDMCLYPVSLRDPYVADVLRVLRMLRDSRFRPHWIAVDECQSFLSPSEPMLVNLFLELMAGGGCGIVSYRPDWIAPPVLERLDHCILTRLSEPEAAQVVSGLPIMGAGLPPEKVPQWHVLVDGQHLLKPSDRRVTHVRHLYKYLDMPLPRHKRFHFRDEQGYLGLEAASLYELKQMLGDLPLESLAYHLNRGDFARWARGSLGDEELASQFEKLARRALEGEELRKAMLQRVTARYTALQALR